MNGLRLINKTVAIFLTLVLMVAVFPSRSFADPEPLVSPGGREVSRVTARLRIPFIENQGQVSSEKVKFYAHTFGGTVFVEEGGVLTYSLPTGDGNGAVVRELFGSGEGAIPAGIEPSVTRVSYFRGSDPQWWRSSLATYGEVSLGEVYEGISLSVRAYGDNVEKLFTVRPGASPAAIRVRVEGVRAVAVAGDGQLEFETVAGPVYFTRPVAYQEIDGRRVQVDVAYAVYDRENYGFEVGSYDSSLSLVIDPLLASTFIGMKSYDRSYTLAVDSSGNVYVAGWTEQVTGWSPYPTTAGAYDRTISGSDAFVSKLNPGLTTLIASTYLGGAGSDWISSLKLDANGDVLVAGLTSSADFPTTEGAFDRTNADGTDAFVTRLSGDLSTLMASTYLGGSHAELAVETNMDRGPDMALDTAGYIYLTGTTYSSDFPTTPGAYQTIKKGADEVYISKLSSNLSILVASTYLGGGREDRGIAIAVDSVGHVFVTGHTDSTNDPAFSPQKDSFPVTPGAFDVTYNDSPGVLVDDGFVSRLNNSLTTLEASTFLGSSQTDHCWAIAVDSSGYVYVGGYTHFVVEPYFPTTPGAYDTSLNGGYDAFLSKFDNNLSTLVAGTFIGGASDERVHGIAIGLGGDVFITGYTWSSGYPTTTGAWDVTFNGMRDVFISRLNSSLSNLIASTFLGGGQEDIPGDVVLFHYQVSSPEARGQAVVNWETRVWIAGYSGYSSGFSDYPTTPGAYDTHYEGGYDVIVSTLDEMLSGTVIVSCDEKGAPRDRFAPGEKVYVRGSGLTASTDYKLWIQSVAVGEGDYMNTSYDPSGTQEIVHTQTNGTFPPAEIWNMPSNAPPGQYDIVVDNQSSGSTSSYSAVTDGLDSETQAGFSVFFPGDASGDGVVNGTDLAAVAAAFGSVPGSANWNAAADFNRDNIVDIFDLVKVGLNYGRSV